MATVSQSILVDCPCSDVFAYVADPRTHHEWQPQLLRTELLSEGEIGAGTRAVEVRRMLGREMRAPFEITRHDPPSRQDFRTTGGPIRPAGVMRCEQIGNATRLSYQFTFTGPMGWLFAHMVGRGLLPNLTRLKQRLEAGASSS